MFSMALSIWGTFGFADYESGERRGLDTDSRFGCIINLLSIHFWINYHLLILLLYLTLLLIITNKHILHNKVLIIIKLKITYNKLIIQIKCAVLSAILDFCNVKLDLWSKQLMPSQSTERKKSWHSQTRLVCDRCCALVNSFFNRSIVTTCP